MNRRPLDVTIIGCMYIVAGATGFAYHVTEFQAPHPLQYDLLWVEVLRLIAIVCGVYMLRGSNWARWLGLVWIAYHVVLSAFHFWSELVIQPTLRSLHIFSFSRPSDAFFSSRENIGAMKRSPALQPFLTP